MSDRVVTWSGFALGLLALGVLGFFTMFLAAQSATGCDQSFGSGMTHPAFCDSSLTRSLVVLLPLIACGVYVVGSILGLVLLRKHRRAGLVPLVLGVLAVGVFVLVLALID
jgi:hypothetical protein